LSDLNAGITPDSTGDWMQAATQKLLEVNPNPGWCWDGHLAKMAAIAGMSYEEMLEAVLKTAEARMLHLHKNEKVTVSGISEGGE